MNIFNDEEQKLKQRAAEERQRLRRNAEKAGENFMLFKKELVEYLENKGLSEFLVENSEKRLLVRGASQTFSYQPSSETEIGVMIGSPDPEVMSLNFLESKTNKMAAAEFVSWLEKDG